MIDAGRMRRLKALERFYDAARAGGVAGPVALAVFLGWSAEWHVAMRPTRAS